MKRLIFVLFALAGVPSLVAAAPATMRVDYYHTGNDKEEYFSLDRVVIEPLPWPGNLTRAIDTTQSRQVFLRGDRRRQQHGALFARLRVDLTANGRRPAKRRR